MGARMPMGERPGRGRAQSLDFDGVTPYAPGDDVRWIDWRATARSGTPQVKRFLAQSHRARMIVPDLRAGLYFGTRDRLMAKTAALAAARLAWECHLLAEPVGLAVPGHEIVEARRGRRHVLRVLDALLAAYDAPQATGDEALAGAALDGAETLRRGDELCVISDFGTGLGTLAARTGALAEARVMRAFVVEDALGSEPLPGGSYPAALPAQQAREVFRVSDRTGSDLPEQARLARADRRRLLLDAGWEVVPVSDLLPRRRVP